jgi:EAL domain-containing protein (putative c-di-GMP-specific phosphodiesterase class I)
MCSNATVFGPTLFPWDLGTAGFVPQRAASRSPGPAVAAFEERHLGLAFQPVVDLADGTVFYQEALARPSSHPTQSARKALIARMESEGTIDRLDAAMLARSALLLAGDPLLRMGVNISCRTLETMGSRLPGLIETLGPLASRLVLEITETVPLADPGRLHRLVDCARKAGCAIAFDDFGAGWFTLGDIAEFRPEIVKLDGAVFKRAFERGETRFLAGLRELSATHPMQLVAEHIESHEMAEFARANDIPWAQGFHLGEPKRMGEGGTLASIASGGGE